MIYSSGIFNSQVFSSVSCFALINTFSSLFIVHVLGIVFMLCLFMLMVCYDIALPYILVSQVSHSLIQLFISVLQITLDHRSDGCSWFTK